MSLSTSGDGLSVWCYTKDGKTDDDVVVDGGAGDSDGGGGGCCDGEYKTWVSVH